LISEFGMIVAISSGISSAAVTWQQEAKTKAYLQDKAPVCFFMLSMEGNVTHRDK
jgi:hypothetical protein